MLRLVLVFSVFAGVLQAQPLCFGLKAFDPRYRSVTLPAGSMKPTIEPATCLYPRVRFDVKEIQPGRVIVFTHPINGAEYVKRVIALEGQSVQMKEGRLWINGAAVPAQKSEVPYKQLYEPEGWTGGLPRCPNAPMPIGTLCEIDIWLETLGGITYQTLDLGLQASKETPEYIVPADHVFVLGDHRDNSVDSRMPRHINGMGFIPLDNITALFERNIDFREKDAK